jgi:hypothetical protein
MAAPFRAANLQRHAPVCLSFAATEGSEAAKGCQQQHPCGGQWHRGHWHWCRSRKATDTERTSPGWLDFELAEFWGIHNGSVDLR